MQCEKHITDIRVTMSGHTFDLFIDNETELSPFVNDNNHRCIVYHDARQGTSLYWDMIVCNNLVYIGPNLINTYTKLEECICIGTYTNLKEFIIDICEFMGNIIEYNLIYNQEIKLLHESIKKKYDISLIVVTEKIAYLINDSIIYADTQSKITTKLSERNIFKLNNGLKMEKLGRNFGIYASVNIIKDPNAKSLSNVCVVQDYAGINTIVSTYNGKKTIIGPYETYSYIFDEIDKQIRKRELID